MEASGERGDSRFNLAYNMNLLSGEPQTDLYSQSAMGRGPSTSVQQIINSRHSIATSVCGIHSARGTPSGLKVSPDGYDEHRGMSSQNIGMDPCTVTELDQDSYTSMQPKKSPPSNGKKTKGRVKIKMEYIENKLRRYTTFSKRKTGIMKKAYELSTLTGTQVMLLVASETGHVYTFATRKLQPMITSEAGKELIQMCLNSPDPMGSSSSSGPSGADQRMSATGFEETELTYNISDDDSKDEAMSPMGDSSDSCSEEEACSVPPEYIQTNLLDYKGVLAAANSNNNSKPSSASKKPPHTTQPNSSSNNNNISTTTVTTNALPSGLKVYQTAQGTIYATTTTPNASGTSTGVLLSLQESRSGNQPHFITIPLQVTADNKPRQSPKTNDTKELDLSTKSNNVNVTVSVAARK